MKAADFFRIEQDPGWSMNGDPWTSWHDVLDAKLLEQVSGET